MTHKDAQRKADDKPKAKARPRGGEGAGGAAPGRERAAGGTSTTQPPAQSFCLTPGLEHVNERNATYDELVAARAVPSMPQPPAQNSPLGQYLVPGEPLVMDNLGQKAARPNGNGDKTLGQHAQNGAQRLHAGDLMPNWTPRRDRPKAVVAHQTPGVVFATPEGQAAFAESVVEHEGIKPACAATGLTPAAVFLYAATHPEFRKVLNSALGANFESQVYKLDELCNKLLDMPPREMNQCANAYGRVFDYRMRIVGKLLPLIYGDQPGTQVNIQNNTGIVCNEATRERLIAINQKLLNVPTETKELEQ